MCQFGYYGYSCGISCGHCVANTTCHSDTGHCPGGCQTGWKEPLCKTRQQVKQTLSFTELLVIWGVLACVLLMIVTFSIFCVVRYRKKKKNKKLRHHAVTEEGARHCEQLSEVNNAELNMEDYEALLKESTSVAIERFPSIYNELLAVLKDGKTPLYYAFHSLRHAEPVYESIQKGPDENVDIPNMSYKDLVRRCQSAPSNQTASLKESTTRLLQIQELRFMVSDVPFLKEDLWATVIKHNVSTCIQIGENTIKRNDRISVKNYIIECTSWNKESSVTSLTVTINSLATGSPTSVKIMAFDFWEKCMEVPIDLLSFIELMNRLSATAEEGAYILIHCQHDISKAVLFAVMFAILTKMKKRRIVDILNPTVTVRRGVPYAIATYEQFKFIHDVVLLAIQRNSI